MANKFWVGGTGTLDQANATNISTTTGGAVNSTLTTGDVLILDGLSGGGTVTASANALTCQGITMGAFTGTLDFAANAPTINLTAASAALSATGSATRTLTLGASVWNITTTTTSTVLNFATITGLTFTAHTATINLLGVNAARKTIALGGTSWGGTMNFANTGKGSYSITGANTITNPVFAAGVYTMWPSGVTNTLSGTITVVGTAADPVGFVNNSDTGVATLAVASASTFDWSIFRQVTFTGAGAKTASNSLDMGLNTGITITPPSVGGSGGVSRARAFGGF